MVIYNLALNRTPSIDCYWVGAVPNLITIVKNSSVRFLEYSPADRSILTEFYKANHWLDPNKIGPMHSHTLGGPPPPSGIVTIRDNRDDIRVLLSSYYTTITGWGVLLTHTLNSTPTVNHGLEIAPCESQDCSQESERNKDVEMHENLSSFPIVGLYIIPAID